MAIRSLKQGLRFSNPIAIGMMLMVLLLLTSSASAQLQWFPHPRNFPTEPSKSGASTARTQQDEPLDLPFWDDFSRPLHGMFPDTLLWVKNYDIWVNEGMAIHPPTLNVATFDGLDSAGIPYNATEIFLSGFTDSLSSQPINLSETGNNPVSVEERPSVFLSFMYQWKGNGEAPDEDDYLSLEFRNDADEWVTILAIEPTLEIRADTFYTVILPVEEDRYFHDAFQFRFRSYGRQSGPYDTWHIDYVYLNKGRNASDLSFPDRAISTRLGPLFGPYRSIPRKHFFSDDQLTPPTFEVRNMKHDDVSVNFRTEGFFYSTDKDGNTSNHQALISKATPIYISNNVMLAREQRQTRLDTLPTLSDAQQFPFDADSTLIRLVLALQTKDNVPRNNVAPIEPDSTGDYTPNYEPIRFTNNDTISADYVLSSYYAYDDGVAELSAGLIQTGNLVAYQFDMPFSESYPQDTLVGFDVYFPPYGITSSQTVDFFIYKDVDDDGKPDEVWLSIPARTIRRKSLNEFQRIKFLPALLIDQPKFFIGWKEPVGGRMLVGLDLSNDTGDKMFVNTNGTWTQNQLVRGSLMVRPIFGHGQVGDQVGVEETLKFSVYPNPSKGRFIIAGLADRVEIISSTGNKVPFTSEQDYNKTIIELRQPAGLYILRYWKGEEVRTEKIIIASH